MEERAGRGRKALRLALTALAVIVSLVALVVPASSAQGTEGSITNNITDTQNLLGNNVGKVSDSIAQVKQKTGVTLNLLYLPSFGGGKPSTWASKQLESTHPKPNTVMLAVASQDGNLAVVVSQNSDGWLLNQGTVDKLSDAAVGPIVNKKSPDWVGSALALADAIEAQKSESDTAPVRTVSIVVLAVILLILLGLVGYFVVRHLQHRSAGRRHAKPRGERAKDKAEVGADSEPDGAAPSQESDDTSDSDAAVDENS